MKDLTESGIFNDYLEEEDDNDSWDYLDEEVYWLFSGADKDTKIEEIKKIKQKQEKESMAQKTQYFIDQEKRIKAKRKELIEKGVIDLDIDDIDDDPTLQITRYGRTPLHEAISMRDIRLVKKYIKAEKYLDCVDNNGHTPVEMAFYEEYKEALILFEQYEKKKEKESPDN